MAMVKIIPYGSQPKLGDQAVELVKVARDGLRGNDFREFVKRASWQLADTVRKMTLYPGDVLIHGIGLGATEFYGANRNGDGFKEANCRKYHPTFVKHAHWYRNHQNKDPKKGYGRVKHSSFNEEMKRIELLAILNGTKEAAERNGGLVADEELKMLHASKDIPTSMACKVAYDVCAGCGNKAKTREEYCLGDDEGGMCKRGGVKNRMCFVHDDGFMNHVDNPEPGFFDWSKVYRGADRISWADGLVKAASGLLMGGAELAEKQGVELPPYMFATDDMWPTQLEKLAAELAQLEIEYEGGRVFEHDRAFAPEFRKEANWVHGGTVKQALAALAMQKIALPVAEWLKLVHPQCDWAAPTMLQHGLPGIYSRMLADGSIKEASTLLPSLHSSVPWAMTRWAHELASDFSLDREHLSMRVKRADLYSYEAPACNRLLLSAGAAETLARGYALYKLAFLQALRDRDEDIELTKQLCVRQHYLAE